MSSEAEAFDPFTLTDADDLFTSVVSPKKAPAPAIKTKVRSFNIKPSYDQIVDKDKSPPRLLLPKMDVKLHLHEEVSSKAVFGGKGEDGSNVEIFVEGKVAAYVQSSVGKLPPFTLQITSPPISDCDITYQNNICRVHNERKTKNEHRAIKCKVEPPKEKEQFDVLRYSMTAQTKNMPILVQSKATLKENTCRVGIQIRSNLSNKGDIHDLSISVPIPNTLQASTVKITRGDGTWNECKRLITWNLGSLAHGQSVLVSLEAEVSHTMAQLLADDDISSTKFNEKIHCPVLVRCSSLSDTLTDFTLSVSPWMEEPSNLSLHQAQSYRLLHRVPTRK